LRQPSGRPARPDRHDDYQQTTARHDRRRGGLRGGAHRPKRAAWSEDPSVIMFWFRPDAGTLTKLAAFDATGRKLPTGHAGIGVG
jgi:hypothetical protein